MISAQAERSPGTEVPCPFQFNPLKHHLAFIKSFISAKENSDVNTELLKTIRRIGSSVMDIYRGGLSVGEILSDVMQHLTPYGLDSREGYARWTGTEYYNFRTLTLRDDSTWTLKYHESESRYVHLFPARYSPHSFRVKANTLKSAILYIITFGKDYVTEEDLNFARAMVNLSPVKEVAETEAIAEMIEILRSS